MRKGDEKRQELLNAAERMFCRQGYEKTSVQDILNVLGLSKGGFYHHFASKEDVLTALCERRAERAAAFARAELADAESHAARLNAVLYAFMPLRKDTADFATMLLPVIDKPEGRAIAMTYQDALLKRFQPLLEDEIASAGAAEAVFPQVKEMERVVLHVVNHCWLEAAAAVLTSVRENGRPDQALLLNTIEKYRRTVEVLLDAPYGSIEIIRVEELDEVARRMMGACAV